MPQLPPNHLPLDVQVAQCQEALQVLATKRQRLEDEVAVYTEHIRNLQGRIQADQARAEEVAVLAREHAASLQPAAEAIPLDTTPVVGEAPPEAPTPGERLLPKKVKKG